MIKEKMKYYFNTLIDYYNENKWVAVAIDLVLIGLLATSILESIFS